MTPKRDLRLAELRGVSGNDEVAHHRKLAAAAERIARNRCNQRLPRARHALEVRERIARVEVSELALRHLLDVSAGGERLFRTGDDDAADRIASASNASSALESSAISASFSAFSAFGRLRRMTPTPPSVSTRMFS
jgi:hypothetical protein